jgi:UPF0755 protein
VTNWRERSAADRESDRLARARRRAERAGRSAPAPEDGWGRGEQPPPAPAPEPEPAAPPEPEPELEPAYTPEPEPPEPPPVPAVARQPEVAGVSARPVKTFPSPPDPSFYVDDEDRDDDLEVASGTRRVSRLNAPRQRKPRAVAGRPLRGGGGSGPKRRHSWLGRIVSLIALVLGAALVWFLIELFQPFGTSPHGRVAVRIAAKSSTAAIATELQHDGVIGSAFFFKLRAALAGDRGKLRAGTYHLQQGMSFHSVLATLTKVPKAAPTTQLTISEGHTRQYTAKLLRGQKIKGDYVALTRHSALLRPQSYGAPRGTPDLEGFLFPDTFTLLDPVKAAALVADQLKDFKKRFATVNLSAARRLHLTPYDVLNVASLIEAESSTDKARPLVASVIYNRLKDHMMLQFDSTTRYATGNFTHDLTPSQLRSRSRWNTHTHFGLPPTPIDSPGMASIQAAAHPARSRYLYFFAKPCTNDTVFATSYTQFLALLARDRRPHCH